ncbi:uncharacterized protein LOC143460005 isoform X1 [Clavelina lepadiformis]|uniref:uncharacterized protein LOC143460005 isoform X1 n=1 Tax=Clavelina lepadiformis TaxID=159417 RepID=UPI0040432BA9
MKASGKSSSSEDRELPSIDTSDQSSSSSLLESSAAPVVLQQPTSKSLTPTVHVSSSETTAGQDEKPTATLSEDRSGPSSEATARNFPLDPQTVESTMEPGNRASSSLPVSLPHPLLAPNYALMMLTLRNLSNIVTYIEVIDGVSRVLHHNPHMPPDQFPYTTPATERVSVNQAVVNEFILGTIVSISQENTTPSLSLASLFPSMIPPQARSYSSNRTSTINVTSTESNVQVIPPLESQISTSTAATNSAIWDQATDKNTTPEKRQPGPRSRSKFTDFQVNILEAAYARNKSLYRGRKQVIAEEADLTEPQVQAWFNNKRQRESKLMKTPKKPSSK